MEKIIEEIEVLFKEILDRNKEKKETLTIDECVRMSGIGRDTLFSLIAKSDTDFPYFKVKSKNLINRTLFIEWLNKISEEHRII